MSTTSTDEATCSLNLRTAGIGGWSWDLSGNTVVYSAEWKALRGYTDRKVGDTIADSLFRVHADDRKALEAQRAKLVSGLADSFSHDYRVQHNNDSWIWVEERTQVVRDHTGTVVRLNGCEIDITHRKQKELSSNDILRQQKHLNEIVEATSDLIGVCTPDCKMLWCNKQLSTLRPDLKEDNADFSIAFPESTQKLMMEVAVPTATEHGRWSGKAAIYDQDDKNEIPVSLVLITHKSADGEIEAFSKIMRDITEQEKVERALRQSESNYARLAATAPVGIFRNSDPTTCVYVNDHWSAKMGRPKEAALGRGWMDFIPPEDQKLFADHSADFFDDPKQVVMDVFEGRYISSDGSLRWEQIHIAKELDDDGNLTGYVGTATDIDRVKRAEEELKEVNKRLQNVLQSSSIGVWEWFIQDEGLIWDEKMHEIYGVAVEDFGGIYNSWLDRVHPDDLERVQEYDHRNLELNQSSAMEFRIVRPDGAVRHIYANVHRQQDEYGKPERITGVNVDITDLRETEFALLESENKFQRMVDHIPGIVYRYFLDPDGSNGWTYLSSNVQEILGFEPSELMSDAELLWQSLESGDAKRLYEKMFESAEKLSVYEEEFPITNAQGITRWYEAICQPQHAEHGRVVWDGVILDITDRKTTAIKLQQAQQQLERITANVPGLIFRYLFFKDGGNVAKYISSKSVDMLGIEPAAALEDATKLWQWIHPDDREPLVVALESAVAELKPLSAEFRVTLPNEKTRWYQGTGLAERQENGDTTLDGVVLDITDRKSAQLAFEDAKLQQDRITDNIPGMLYQYLVRTDDTHALSYVSPQSQELYGLSPEEITKDADRVFNMIHPDDLPATREKFAESARTLQPLKAEYRVMLPDGELRWQQSIGQPTRTESEDTIWDGIVTDVTQQKQAELQLRMANNELARATKLKDEFLANMSHELRTPLGAILGIAEGLQHGIYGSVTGDQKESYEVIEQSATHLLSLINEVLDLAKIGSGSMEMDFTAIDTRELFSSSLKLVARQAHKKNIRLNTSIPFDMPPIEADETRLRQVLINLLDNAVKFTPDNGQITLDVQRLEPTVDRLEKMVRISVTDTGIGFDNSRIDSLFEPFTQVDAALNRNYQGTGLGLALVKQFVELHSGHVSVTSELGVGSCFSIQIPQRQPATRSAKPQDISRAQQSCVGNKAEQSPFVLLAEDNEPVAKATARYLEASNFSVHVVTNGQAAIDTACEKLPDIILMDVQMPGVDGLEAIRRLREIPALQKTPIIALTGLAMPGDSKRCLAVGANSYFSKPYRMMDLVNAMQILLPQSELVTS